MSVTLSPVAPRDLKAELAARPDAVVLDAEAGVAGVLRAGQWVRPPR